MSGFIGATPTIQGVWMDSDRGTHGLVKTFYSLGINEVARRQARNFLLTEPACFQGRHSNLFSSAVNALIVISTDKALDIFCETFSDRIIVGRDEWSRSSALPLVQIFCSVKHADGHAVARRG